VLGQKKGEGGPIPVCVAGGSVPASRYILTVLRRSGIIEAFSLEEASQGQSVPAPSELVLVIDQRSAPPPLEHFLHTLRSRFPAGRVLIVGDESSGEELCHLLRIGMRGFVTYGELGGTLCRAVEAVWEGGLWVTRKVFGLFVESVSRRSQKSGGSRDIFTPQEKMVLESLGRDLCNKEISRALDVSEDTVKFHLRNIFTKLGVHDRHAAVESAKRSLARETPHEQGEAKIPH